MMSAERGERMQTDPLPPRPASRQRVYLRLIAAWKAAEGFLLLGVGLALLFLDVHGTWLGAIVAWVERELLLIHFNPLLFLLRQLEDFLLGGHLRSAASLAIVFAAVHITEGVGVWFGQRWAEWLMVVATAGLIPLEIAHLVAHPTLAKLGIIAVNIAVVLYLIAVLRRSHATTR
jgi:uncharacterized membrane protein (DUF2068 family)